MKWLIVDLDANGRSSVVERGELPERSDHLVADAIFETRDVPPPSAPRGRGTLLPIAPPPGRAHWTLVSFPPGDSHANHQTTSVDFDTVLAGSIELELDDGTHHLTTGDCVVVNGVDHAWRAGPDGCSLAVLMIGAGDAPSPSRPPA